MTPSSEKPKIFHGGKVNCKSSDVQGFTHPMEWIVLCFFLVCFCQAGCALGIHKDRFFCILKVVFLKLLSQVFPQCWEVPLLDLLFKTGVDVYTFPQTSGQPLKRGYSTFQLPFFTISKETLFFLKKAFWQVSSC